MVRGGVGYRRREGGMLRGRVGVIEGRYVRG